MNWIKVTNETVVPTDVSVLIKASSTGEILKGRIIPETNSIFEVGHSETTYLKAEYSHYCVITEPKEIPEDSLIINNFIVPSGVIHSILLDALGTHNIDTNEVTDREALLISNHLVFELRTDKLSQYKNIISL